MIWTKTRRALSASLAVALLGGVLAAPVTAHADDKSKKGKIIVGDPIITNDPPPAPPPKKKDK